MLLLKVSGIAEDPELESEFLNSWLLLDFEVVPVDATLMPLAARWLFAATSEVFPSTGPLADFCFKVGSLSRQLGMLAFEWSC